MKINPHPLVDAVQQAKSGHPGTPMALAPLVYTIWNAPSACGSSPHAPAKKRER